MHAKRVQTNDPIIRIITSFVSLEWKHLHNTATKSSIITTILHRPTLTYNKPPSPPKYNNTMLELTTYARRSRPQSYIPHEIYPPYLYTDYTRALDHYPRRAPSNYKFLDHRASTPPFHSASSSYSSWSTPAFEQDQKDPATCVEAATRAHVTAKSEYEKAKEKYDDAKKKFEECEGRLKECSEKLQRAKLGYA